MGKSLREIADKLGVSTSTVSRALHRSPLVNAATLERVRSALEQEGYWLDPIVSAGMSRIRQQTFYRETLVWCGDSPRESMPWLADFFRAVEDYGARLGYAVEYFHFAKGTQRELARLASIWRARGIRGVILGPFLGAHETLVFPWKGFAWISIGHAVETPVLHSVGRDYVSDMRTALAWLETHGVRRPCCVLDPRVSHLFREPLLPVMLAHYHGRPRAPGEPLHELDPTKAGAFEAWFKRARPDGVILPRALRGPLREMTSSLDGLPQVLLSPLDEPDGRGTPHFVARYEVIGQVAVNLLHRLLNNREFGLPAYRQTVALDSLWSETGAPTG